MIDGMGTRKGSDVPPPRPSLNSSKVPLPATTTHLQFIASSKAEEVNSCVSPSQELKGAKEGRDRYSIFIINRLMLDLRREVS